MNYLKLMTKINNALIFVLLAIISLIPEISFAGTDDTIATLVCDLERNSLTPIKTSMIVIAGVMGVFLTLKGILKLKDYTDSKGQRTTINQALGYLFVGTVLTSVPAVIFVGSNTFGLNKGGNTQQEGAVCVPDKDSTQLRKDKNETDTSIETEI